MAEGTHLNHHHQVTVEEIFRHPVGHNIEWHDVLSLLDKVGTVVAEENGRFTVTVGAETETFDEPRHHDVDVQQVLDVRRMLGGVGITPESFEKHQRS
jgi:hypothetical protein